jgi:hypothetical protein
MAAHVNLPKGKRWLLLQIINEVNSYFTEVNDYCVNFFVNLIQSRNRFQNSIIIYKCEIVLNHKP